MNIDNLIPTLLSVLGFASIVTGIWILGGAGYAFVVGGLVLFIAGGVASGMTK